MTQLLFTVHKPIHEMVAESIARTETVKIKLLALLVWARIEAKRILSYLATRIIPIPSQTEMWCELYVPAAKKPAPAKPYSNKYGHKSKAAPPTVKRNEQREVLPVPVAVKPIVPTAPKPINADKYINPVVQNGLLVPAGYTAPATVAVPAEERIGDEKVLADIARREAVKMDKYAEAWKQKAATLAQTMPTTSRENAIKLSNTDATVGKTSAGRSAYSASSSKTRGKRK